MIYWVRQGFVKKKKLSFRKFTFLSGWLCWLLFSGLLSAQTPAPDPKEEDEEPPFWASYHVLPGISGTYENYAYAINQSGQIAGETHFAENETAANGTIWWPTGEGDEGYSAAYAPGSSYDINDKGNVAPGMDYGPSYNLPGSDTDGGAGVGMAINNSDEVVGTGWEVRPTEGPWVMDPSGEGGHNSWFKVTTQTFPAKVQVDIAIKLGGAHKSTDVQTTMEDGTQVSRVPKNAGMAWSIDDKGFCVGIDADGNAVWNYKSGYRKEPAGAEKRLISISPEGVVCGTSNEGPTLWPKHGEDPKIVLPLPENAGDGDHFVTAVSDTGWAVGQVNGRINVKEDHQWKGGRAYAWKQEGVDENGKPNWTMMDLSKFAPKGWKHLTIYDVNRSGKAVGFALVEGKYCGVMIELSPQLMAIDANRDGITMFEDDPRVIKNPKKFSDLTTSDKPFRFWLNDDEDDSPNSERIPVTKPNFVDAKINGIRDLEDFYRIKIRLFPEWEKKLKSGYKLKIESKDDLKINFFKAAFYDEYASERDYLTKEESAQIQIGSDPLKIVVSGNLGKILNEKDFDSKEILLLWEAERKRRGSLKLSLYNREGKVEVSSEIHLDLHPIEEFFEEAETVSEEIFLPPYMVDGFVPNLSAKLLHGNKIQRWDGEEDKVAVVFVHGWRMPDYEAINWGQMMYKRLWHASYKGKYFFFRWPTYSADESPSGGFYTYNKSEHRAWESGKVLKDYLNDIRSKIPSEYKISLCAHSMGNIVAGEAVKQGAPVSTYVMLQAAVSASSYDDRAVLKDGKLKSAEQLFGRTPQLAEDMGYVGYFKNNKVEIYNFHNKYDFAMKLYLSDQFGFKVDPAEIRGGGEYSWIAKTAGIYRVSHRALLLREITNPYECMAFLARSLTKAVGGEPRTLNDGSGQGGTGPLKQAVNLNSRFGFGSEPTDHSGEFNRSIQEEMIPFYAKLVDSLTQKDDEP